MEDGKFGVEKASSPLVYFLKYSAVKYSYLTLNMYIYLNRFLDETIRIYRTVLS